MHRSGRDRTASCHRISADAASATRGTRRHPTQFELRNPSARGDALSPTGYTELLTDSHWQRTRPSALHPRRKGVPQRFGIGGRGRCVRVDRRFGWVIQGSRGPSASCRRAGWVLIVGMRRRVRRGREASHSDRWGDGFDQIAAAVALAKRGARVVLMGRRADKLNARARGIRSALDDVGVDHQPADVATLVVDVSDMDSVRSAADEARRRFAAIDGLGCCRSARSFREVPMCWRTGTR
jgi:hypothetical protein